MCTCVKTHYSRFLVRSSAGHFHDKDMWGFSPWVLSAPELFKNCFFNLHFTLASKRTNMKFQIKYHIELERLNLKETWIYNKKVMIAGEARITGFFSSLSRSVQMGTTWKWKRGLKARKIKNNNTVGLFIYT